jgi:hypothetical protein
VKDDALLGLPTSLPSLETALEAASSAFQGVSCGVVPDYDQLPETVRRLREARLKRQIREAERRALSAAKKAAKRGKRKRLHYTQKKATKRRSNARYHEKTYHLSLKHRFSRWKRRSRTKAEGIEMSLEEFGFFWLRIDPKWDLPFYRVPEMVKWTRLDPEKPWSLLNLDDTVKIGRGRKIRLLKWKTLLLEEDKDGGCTEGV